MLTSLHEGLPMVIPEAMAAGKPVVATAVDGVPEAVSDGKTGFLREVGDVATLAEAVNQVLSDPGLARKMGMEARKQAEEWDITVMVRRLEALYGELVGWGRVDTFGFPGLMIHLWTFPNKGRAARLSRGGQKLPDPFLAAAYPFAAWPGPGGSTRGDAGPSGTQRSGETTAIKLALGLLFPDRGRYG